MPGRLDSLPGSITQAGLPDRSNQKGNQQFFQRKKLCKKQSFDICRADWIRTSDPYVPNVVRYRAALLPAKKRNHPGFPCRVDWIRTSDHLHPIQVRYRAAPPPEYLKIILFKDCKSMIYLPSFKEEFLYSMLFLN